MDPDPLSYYYLAFLLLASKSFIIIASVLMLLILSGLISASEVAFFSLSKKELEDSKEQYPKKIEKINLLLKDKKSLLATILILNNFINITIVILVASYTSTFIFTDFSITNSLVIPANAVKLIFDLGFITLLILFFGEIIPKVYAQKNALTFSLKMINILSFFNKVLKPISIPLISLTKFAEKNIKGESFSVDQLSHALEITSDDESTSTDEQKILEGIVTFGNTLAKEIMTPRVDMFAIEKTTDYSTVLEKVKDNGYSRIPVYENNEDTICGILYAKDLIQHLNQKNYNWFSLIRKPLFVPENKKLDDLLSDFQSLKTHLAVVVDEYGGTSGVISLEDVIEEIVGDISDEFDEDEVSYTKLKNNTYLFEGKTSIKDFLRIINADNEELIEQSKGEAETIAGFILEQTEGFPVKNQVINFHNFTFKIEAKNKKRIKQIKVVINNTSNEEE